MNREDQNYTMASYQQGHPGSETAIIPLQDMSEDYSTSAEGTVVEDTDIHPLGRRNTFTEHEFEELNRIATNISRRRSHATQGKEALTPTDSALDPNSKNFDLEQWTKQFISGMQSGGLEKTPLGFTFKNLSVSGSGKALQLQSTLSDVFLSPFRFKETFGSDKSHRKILNDFNANVRPGELLVVLGRPGSGCSTFLKSTCGELHGLKLENPDSIRYDGISQKQMVKEFGGELVYNQEVSKHNTLPDMAMTYC
jgi:ABC-type multidrug transport system fused ATPase/permease subunit